MWTPSEYNAVVGKHRFIFVFGCWGNKNIPGCSQSDSHKLADVDISGWVDDATVSLIGRFRTKRLRKVQQIAIKLEEPSIVRKPDYFSCVEYFPYDSVVKHLDLLWNFRRTRHVFYK